MTNPLDSTNTDPLDPVVADYLQKVEAGSLQDRDALLAAHPDLADRLQAFFADLDRVGPPAAEFRLPDLELPENFGDYEFLGEIGRGGMGVVYRVRQKSLGRVVALKMILSGPVADTAALRRFREEAETVSRLDHPHVVPIYEVGEHRGLPFFTMKLIEGESLTKGLDRYKSNPKAAAELLVKVCGAVHHAHQRGVLHRDLKPGNILVDPAGEPHVTDFGLARRVDEVRTLTHSGAILGTPEYMAPEQAAGRKDLTIAVDVYGLGAILYALLTGHPPFRKNSIYKTLQAVVEDDPERPRILRPSVPRDLEVICLKCLIKEPDRRYPSAQALADDLGRWLRGEPIEARRVGRIERYRMWARRKPLAATLSKVSALSALLIVGGTTIFGWQMNRSNTQVVEAKQDLVDRTAEFTERIKRLEAKNRRLEYDLWLARRHTVNQTLERVAKIYNRDPKAAFDLLHNHELCPIDHRDAAWRYYESAARAHARASQPGTVLAWGPAISHFSGEPPGPHQPHGGRLWAVVRARPEGNSRLLDYERPDVVKWPLQVVDLLSGELRAPIPEEAGCQEAVESVAISLDGSTIAWIEKHGYGYRLAAWDVKGRKRYTQSLVDFDYSNRTPLVLSPDGRHVLLPSAEMTEKGYFTGKRRPARLLDIRKGDEGYCIPDELTPVSSSLPAMTPVFSPDGKYLAYWIERNNTINAIQVIDLAAGKPLATLATLPADPDAADHARWDPLSSKSGICPELAFSPDSRSLLRVGCERFVDGRWYSMFLNVYALDGSLTRKAHIPLGQSYAVVRFSPDGRYVGVWGTKGIHVIDGSTWELKHTLANGSGNFVFDADSKQVISLGVPKLTTWDIRTGEGRDLRHGEFGTLIGMGRRGELRSVLTGDYGRPLVTWDLNSREPSRMITPVWPGGASGGRVVLRRAAEGESFLIDYSVLRVKDGKFAGPGAWDQLLRTGPSFQVEMRTDRFDIASGEITRGEGRSEKLPDNRPPWPVDSFRGRHIDLQSDEWRIVKPLPESQVELFTPWLKNQRTGEQRGHGIDSRGKRDLGTTPDGNTVLLGAIDGSVELWDVWTGKRRVTLAGHSKPVVQALWTEDGTQLATADENGVVRLWDMRGASPCRGIFTHSSGFTPNGEHLLSWNEEDGIKFVSRKSGLGELLPGECWMPDPERRYRGESILCFTPDGQYLLRGESHRLRVVEVATGKTLAKVRFGADGKRIEYEEVGNDHNNEAIRVWTVSPDGTFVAFARTLLLDPEKKKYELQLWRLNIPDGTSQLLNRIPIDWFSLSSFRLDVTFDSAVLVLNQGAKRWKWFDAKTGELTRETELDIWTRDRHDWQTPLHPPRIGAAPRIHPGGNLALTRDDRGPFIWDFATGKERWRPTPTGWRDFSGDFSPDGRVLAIGDERGVVTIWEAETGKQVATYHIRDVVPGQIKISHCGVSFDPTSSRVIATVGFENELSSHHWPSRVIVWDLPRP